MSDGLATQPNVSQRLMLQWERFAPYNASQFATFDTLPDPARLASAFRSTVISLGLQQIGQHPDLSLLQPAESLDGFITHQMNHRFTPGESPLKPFLIIENKQAHVGVVYRHVVADSASIRLVMRQWLTLFLKTDSAKPPFTPVSTMREPAFALLRRHRLGLIGETMNELSRLSRMKRVRRLAYSDPTQPIVWQRFTFAEGLIDRLVAYARARDVKVNDLFVAAAAEACDRWLPHEHAESRRDLAIGTIVDTRDANDDPQRQFGLSLGFLQSTWRWQQLRSWDDILRNAANQAKRARDRGMAKSSELRLRAATWFSADKLEADVARFYRKRCPLAAGISNVNLTPEWPMSSHPSPLTTYSRVSPLGPMLPIVFTPTTLGNTLNLGFTYRSRVIPDGTAKQILAAFVARLESLGD